MRAVVQRVSWARVSVDGEVRGTIGQGLMVLVGAGQDSTDEDAKKLADRVVGLRIFNDATGKMNLSLGDLQVANGPRILAVSNFTLYGDAWSSRRPSFTKAAGYADGERLYEVFLSELQRLQGEVAGGVFGADMQVEMLNDGPVTILIDTHKLKG
ncbi:MAG: D-tyrosyl-tRNA(Tyr) deacylase [Armatimonadetes bacterium]|nr:D-tyrosyl-tRNA(Tyr) deacylase [Armatimonadota bacterium]